MSSAPYSMVIDGSAYANTEIDRLEQIRSRPVLASPQTLVDVRPIRDEVERRVLTLMSELGLTPAQTGDRA